MAFNPSFILLNFYLQTKEVCILLMTVTLFLKCHAKEYPMPKGYDWMIRGGTLFIKAGEPRRYLTMRTDMDWREHSWLKYDTPKPAEAEIIPLSSDVKQLIVEEINIRRAKTLLGTYFDPDRALEFGVVPPPGELSTVEYNEDIARTTERYIQHLNFNHYVHRSFYPHVPLGENLHWVDDEVSLPSSLNKTLHEILDQTVNVTKEVLYALREWFEEEMPYYRHYEPYRTKTLNSQLQKFYIDPIKNNPNLSDEEKDEKLEGVQFGHYTALVAQNIHSVGCAMTRNATLLKEGGFHDTLKYSVYFACHFGGGMTTEEEALFDMDEHFLEQLGLSKEVFENPYK